MCDNRHVETASVYGGESDMCPKCVGASSILYLSALTLEMHLVLGITVWDHYHNIKVNTQYKLVETLAS